MKIATWNVNSIRTRQQQVIEWLKANPVDILCLQETKAEESQITLSDTLSKMYPFRFWESTKGTTQRKGLSGTAIWSKIKPIRQYNPPDEDEEGRMY